jgi:hypothetical protein
MGEKRGRGWNTQDFISRVHLRWLVSSRQLDAGTCQHTIGACAHTSHNTRVPCVLTGSLLLPWWRAVPHQVSSRQLNAGTHTHYTTLAYLVCR